MALTDELRISLPFNGNWLDKSGNSNDVTPSGIILKTDTPKIGSGYAFGDGLDDDGEIADSPSLDASYITVACWLKYTTSGVTLPFERSDGVFSANDWGLATVNTKIRFQIHIGGGNRRADSPLAYNDDNWHLIIGMYDGAYVRLFIDNIYVAEIAAPFGDIGDSTDPLTLFARKGKIIPFPGGMDSFLMWGKALSWGDVSIGQQITGEMAAVWNGGTGIELEEINGLLISRGRLINLGGNLGGLTKSTLNNLGGI